MHNDVPTITLTDSEAMMAREAIAKFYADPWCRSTELRLRAEQLVHCIDQRRQAANARYWSAPSRVRRAVRRVLRGFVAWLNAEDIAERASGAALFLIAAALLGGALWTWLY
jgi:hypothetical protein